MIYARSQLSVATRLAALFLTISLLSFSIAQALPAGKNRQLRNNAQNALLPGVWTSTDLSGDAIWLIVDQVEVTFYNDGTFQAQAQMSGGGVQTYNGHYFTTPGQLHVHSDEIPPVVCDITQTKNTFTIKPKNYDITASFKRGKATTPQPSSGNFFNQFVP